MKLRLRSLESKLTTRVDLPDPCSLDHLKIVVAQLLSTACLPVYPPSIFLSLNRKDELHSQSPQVLLLDLNLTSGDLVFYTLNPHAFRPKTSTDLPIENPLEASSFKTADQICTQIELHSASEKGSSLFDSQSMKLCGHTGSIEGSSSKFGVEIEKTDDHISESNEEASKYDLQSMDIEGDTASPWKEFSVPFFLRGVLTKDTDEDDDHMLMVNAVHTVLLEAGFVGYDPVSLTMVHGLPPLHNYICATLSYTLPEILSSGAVETVAVKFQKLGRFVNVYGSLGRNASRLSRVCLDEHKFVPIIKSIRTYSTSAYGGDASLPSVEEKLFEFWKIVKDGLALPLLIDICEITGFEPPPCLIRLPSELKLKILELLRGIDIAKMEVVCSEFRYLSMDNDLWKQKFLEEFGNTVNQGKCFKWKWKYASSWKNMKSTRSTGHVTYPLRWRGGPNHPILPGILGGDYDRFPSMGFPGSFRSPSIGTHGPPLLPHLSPFRHSNGRRNFIPPCFHSTFDT